MKKGLAVPHYLKIIIFITFLISGCSGRHSGKPQDLIIFHAGSLSVPCLQLKTEFEKLNPGVRVLLEPAGSLVCARKITELKRECDIMASADYFVINELLIPDYADWSIKFATNEIVIAYGKKAKYASEINGSNWFEILSRPDVIYARSDPDSDPCGYRTLFSLMLAEKYYGKCGLADKMAAKNRDYIRPKEVDLIALLESNAIDYMFQYKSVAIQHGLNYVTLPSEINLSDPEKQELYKSVSTDVTGSKPETRMKVTGDYINYSITIPKNSKHKDIAIDFLCFMLGEKGVEILRHNGQKALVPFISEQPEKLPQKLNSLINAGK
jgi:molybdate/tungstate transport system substrate-binding protein